MNTDQTRKEEQEQETTEKTEKSYFFLGSLWFLLFLNSVLIRVHPWLMDLSGSDWHLQGAG